MCCDAIRQNFIAFFDWLSSNNEFAILKINIQVTAMHCTNKEIETVVPYVNADYIDLVDVVGFLWRGRIWILSSIILGMLGAAAMAVIKFQPTYYTSVPLIKGSDSPGAAAAELSRVIEAPKIKATMMDRYVAHSAGEFNVDGNFPLKITSSATNLDLEISAKSQDATGLRALGIAHDLNLSLIELKKSQNERLSKHASAEAFPIGNGELETAFTKLVALQNSEESPHRVKLFALEATLSQRAGVRPTPSTFVLGTSIGDDVLRLLGALDGKMSREEQMKILVEYGQITGAIRAIQAKYDQPIKELSARFAQVSAEIIASVPVPIPIPIPVVDEAAFKSAVAAGTHERKETKQPFVLAVGVILGALFGIVGFGIKVFIGDNRERLRAALSAK